MNFIFFKKHTILVMLAIISTLLYLSREWVFYMKHLKQDYPYLFSLAVRLNPMLEHPDPQVY